MLQNRLHRILFITFSAIIFAFYCFYSNEIIPNQNYSSIQSLINSNHSDDSLEKLIIADEINIFLDYSKKISIEPFLIEPFFLYNFLNEKSKAYFLHYNINPNVFKWKYNFITFGLKVPNNISKLDQISKLICQGDDITQIGFECTKFYGNDHTKEWHLDEKINNITTQIPISFLLNYKLKNFKIHLVLFYLRTRSLWTGQINELDVNDEFQSEKKNFEFGLYEELFDDFNIFKTKKNLFIPNDIFAFLMQKNNSRLIECDRQLATNYYEKYSNKDFKRSKFVRDSLVNIYYFKEMMKDYKMPFWMSSGTLLGWYRQCNVISYTTDIDFAADSRFASEEMTNSLMKNKYNFKFLYIWGLVENGYEYSFLRGKYKADLFFVYPAHDGKVAIFGHQKTSYNRYFYPQFNLCTGQLRGILINVPCNTKELLELEYGEDWVKPVIKWDYISNPLNKGPTEYWQKKNGLITFRQF